MLLVLVFYLIDALRAAHARDSSGHGNDSLNEPPTNNGSENISHQDDEEQINNITGEGQCFPSGNRVSRYLTNNGMFKRKRIWGNRKVFSVPDEGHCIETLKPKIRTKEKCEECELETRVPTNLSRSIVNSSHMEVEKPSVLKSDSKGNF